MKIKKVIIKIIWAVFLISMIFMISGFINGIANCFIYCPDQPLELMVACKDIMIYYAEIFLAYLIVNILLTIVIEIIEIPGVTKYEK